MKTRLGTALVLGLVLLTSCGTSAGTAKAPSTTAAAAPATTTTTTTTAPDKTSTTIAKGSTTTASSSDDAEVMGLDEVQAQMKAAGITCEGEPTAQDAPAVKPSAGKEPVEQFDCFLDNYTVSGKRWATQSDQTAAIKSLTKYFCTWSIDQVAFVNGNTWSIMTNESEESGDAPEFISLIGEALGISPTVVACD